MFYLMIFVFIIGYIMITLEQNININKAAFALLLGALLWTLYSIGADSILDMGLSNSWNHFMETELDNVIATHEDKINFITNYSLIKNLGTISSTLFFLLGAMTIVELIDINQGFYIISSAIKSKNLVKLMWGIAMLTFFMSSLLDNLTTTIIVLTILNKLFKETKTRWIFASLVIIAANAGGAWSPIGDVTTIMLWINGEVTSAPLITHLFIPSSINAIVATLLLSRFLKKIQVNQPSEKPETKDTSNKSIRTLILVSGCLTLISVPVFKAYTHLPPYMGMLLGLSILWIITDRRAKKLRMHEQNYVRVTTALHSIDISTILFFLGILTAVGALESAGHLTLMANWLSAKYPNIYITNGIIGIISSIVDNVPLVAAAMGMYTTQPATAVGELSNYMINGDFWNLLAYCAGTGGSLLIIGSAAGVAAMGIERINFIWYFKKITGVAFISYVAGIGAYYLQSFFL